MITMLISVQGPVPQQWDLWLVRKVWKFNMSEQNSTIIRPMTKFEVEAARVHSSHTPNRVYRSEISSLRGRLRCLPRKVFPCSGWLRRFVNEKGRKFRRKGAWPQLPTIAVHYGLVLIVCFGSEKLFNFWQWTQTDHS